jgi:hypothetical protein
VKELGEKSNNTIASITKKIERKDFCICVGTPKKIGSREPSIFGSTRKIIQKNFSSTHGNISKNQRIVNTGSNTITPITKKNESIFWIMGKSTDPIKEKLLGSLQQKNITHGNPQRKSENFGRNFQSYIS